MVIKKEDNGENIFCQTQVGNFRKLYDDVYINLYKFYINLNEWKWPYI